MKHKFQEEIIREDGQEVLNLGLLVATDEDNYCFPHSLFQGFVAGKFISTLPKVMSFPLVLISLTEPYIRKTFLLAKRGEKYS